MIRTIGLWLLLALSQQAIADASAAENVGRDLVEHFVHDISTMTSRFEQSLIDANGIILETSSGTLDINRPGQFRWAYAEPYEQWLVADGLNIWSYDVDLAQVTVKPQQEALAHTPALLLGGSAEVMDEFVYDGTAEDGGMIWVRLTPVDTESGFSRVELGFSGDTLARMVFFDNLEQTTIVSLYDVVVDDVIDPEIFVFAVPDDVDVVGTPATADAN